MNGPSNPSGPWSQQQPQPGAGGVPRPAIGTGEGEVPLAKPPAQSMNVRTLASDLASMQSTGGTQPRPYTPPQGGGGAPRPTMPAPAVPPRMPSYPPTPMPTPMPKPPAPGMFPQASPNMPAPAKAQTAPIAAPVKHSKGLLVGTIIVVAIVALGALGYFVVYPLISAPAVNNLPPVVPAPNVPAPESPAPVPPPANEPTPPVLPAAETLPIPAHTSLFKAPADLIEDIALTENSIAEFKRNVPFDTAEVSILRELSVTASLKPLTLEAFIALAAPGLFDRDTLGALGNDVTVFSYTDAQGTWPGFAVRAVDGTALAALALKVNQRLEQAGALSSLFLTDPGTSGDWKTGSTSGVENRYQTFTLAGAALNYGWTDRTLIVATSYEAFRTALGRMK